MIMSLMKRTSPQPSRGEQAKIIAYALHIVGRWPTDVTRTTNQGCSPTSIVLFLRTQPFSSGAKRARCCAKQTGRKQLTPLPPESRP